MNREAEEQFARALRGEPAMVVGLGGGPALLPVATWQRDVDADDAAMLRHCVGSTLDVGCGPGRMTAALARAGQVALGIDIVPDAVAQTIDRGGVAICRDLFEALPGEGRWQCALLADGNVGIGGDPAALLGRVRQLLAPGGRAVVEVAAPGVRSSSRTLRLDVAGSTSAPFLWAFVGADDIDDVARDAGLVMRSLHPHGVRWCSVLEAP